MRFSALSNLRLLNPSSHPLELSAAGGERLLIYVLDDDLVRVRMLPDARPRLQRTWMVAGTDGDAPTEGRSRDDLAPFSLPPFTLETTPQGLTLATRLLRLEIRLDPPQLRWSDSSNKNTFLCDLPTRAYGRDREGKAVWHYLERRPGEHYYGLGERSGPLDKRGRRFRMHNLDALGYDAERTDPLYKHFPFYITFQPQTQTAFGLFYDNLASCVFDLGQEVDAYHGDYRYYQADEGDLDYYLIYGPSIPRVVERFSALTGRMPLPPRWSLGYLGSTMSYTEAPDAQEQLKRFVELCERHRIPCDGFHLSSGYTLGEDGKRYVFTWNRKRVPQPEQMSENFHRGGMHVLANIKPALLTTHPYYAEARAAGLFVRQAERDEPQISMFWGGEGSYLDFTNPAAFAWWKQRVKDSLLAYGIDSTWNDNNEFEIWDDAARLTPPFPLPVLGEGRGGAGEGLTIGAHRPLMPMLMARASRQAQLEFRPDERPFLISRSGCPGIQRYAQTWSGDNHTSWNSLRYNIPMGLGMSLCGAPSTGHDVGGFYGSLPGPELFVRWVQNGIFHPRFTIHSWHTDGSVNEPWMYPEVLPAVREAIEFRYRLLPYLYSLFVEASRSGTPIIRPLVYAFPEDPRCHTESFDFLLGPSLLVASVLEEGARSRRVYLPQGVRWCDFHSGQWFEGGQQVELAAPLERTPLLARAGGIIPMGRSMRHVGAVPDDLRRAYAFLPPGAGRASGVIYEDDGRSFAYQRGGMTTVTLEVEGGEQTLACQAKALGGYPLPYRTLEFVFPPGETRRVLSAAETWRDADGRLHATVAVQAG